MCNWLYVQDSKGCELLVIIISVPVALNGARSSLNTCDCGVLALMRLGIVVHQTIKRSFKVLA
jgi:hypothetical protein